MKYADKVLQKAAEISRNPPPPSYGQDQTLMSPGHVYREPEPFYPVSYPPMRGPQPYPPGYSTHQAPGYPHLGGSNGYNYPPSGTSGYSNPQLPYSSGPGSCYESQPMSMEPASMNVADGPKHEVCFCELYYQ